jgi:hypothetical protein
MKSKFKYFFKTPNNLWFSTAANYARIYTVLAELFEGEDAFQAALTTCSPHGIHISTTLPLFFSNSATPFTTTTTTTTTAILTASTTTITTTTTPTSDIVPQIKTTLTTTAKTKTKTKILLALTIPSITFYCFWRLRVTTLGYHDLF